MAKPKPNLLTQTDNGVKAAKVHDLVASLEDEIIRPFEFLSTLLRTNNSLLAFEAADLKAFGWLLDSLCDKAKRIIVEHLGDTVED